MTNTIFTILVIAASIFLSIAVIIAAVKLICKLVTWIKNKRKAKKAKKEEATTTDTPTPSNTDSDKDEGTSTASEEVKPCACTEAGALEKAEAAEAEAKKAKEEAEAAKAAAEANAKAIAKAIAEMQHKERLAKNAEDIRLVEGELALKRSELATAKEALHFANDDQIDLGANAKTANKALLSASSAKNNAYHKYTTAVEAKSAAEIAVANATLENADEAEIEAANANLIIASDNVDSTFAELQAAIDALNNAKAAKAKADNEVSAKNGEIEATQAKISKLEAEIKALEAKLNELKA